MPEVQLELQRLRSEQENIKSVLGSQPGWYWNGGAWAALCDLTAEECMILMELRDRSNHHND